MNGGLYSYDPSIEYYTENAPVYRNNFSSTFTQHTTNNYLRHSYSPCTTHEDIHLQNKKQANTVNQRHVNLINLQQQQRQSYFDKHNIYNDISPSTAYYDRIHAQTRSNATIHSQPKPSASSLKIKQSKETLPLTINRQIEPNSIIVSTNNSFQPILKHQPSMHKPIADHTPSLVKPLSDNNDPPLDYPNYTMDTLIQRLVPSDIYKPKDSFIYPLLMCSRIHMRPSLLLNKLAHLTINSITNLTYDRGVRTMKNFLSILSQWTQTFPYDFRNTEMMSQFEELLRKINSYTSTLQNNTKHIDEKLRSKLKALAKYEEYIRQLDKKAAHCPTQTGLYTDIINECPTSISLAQQLAHIELDRLKPIGAEELIQYFIAKSASEEARAHPNRIHHNQTTSSNAKSLNIIHDIKLTTTFETYIQWSNRLTFFVTTEIVKHTQKRLRIQLINYFIDVAHECLRLHNFNSMFGIIGGLNMQPVKRLKKTWEKIPRDRFEELEQYINATKNFTHYRRALETAMDEAKRHEWKIDNIVIPFTSLILQDVYYIKTHSKDYTSEGGINLQKFYSMAKFILEEFMQCKQSNCSFKRDDAIINYIVTTPTFSEDALMLASFECEPAITSNEKEKLSLLQKSVNTSSSKF
ncbi:unnamed protein product [Adineta steineri]|uniref:Ras guanine nucleotide exchange factor n=1 Tax=Adineta steineri TaxID=433720 RepID=A0A813VFD3_9BILA|nr:unnamed protein product [Adineta steineri]CAF0854729.1 unnamed protein product [Adineta steineri]CAF3542463.1 unnamed protein product [Adineta steineri]CAF3971040.1 unnamed protein product [Adineta steineri]